MEQSYDSELQALQETIQQKVVTLLSDPDNTVKMTLIDNDIGRLCHFFGRQKGEVCESGWVGWYGRLRNFCLDLHLHCSYSSALTCTYVVVTVTIFSCCQRFAW